MDARKRELFNIDQAIEQILLSNLDDKTKKFIIEELNRRVFELRTEIAQVERYNEMYKSM